MIVSKLTSFIFRVKLRNAVFVVSHDRLNPCRDREVPQWIKHWRNNPGISQDTASSKGDDRVYCFCRKQWQGRFMIQCETCNEWYHGACINITPTDALDIDEYKCSECLKRERRLQ